MGLREFAQRDNGLAARGKFIPGCANKSVQHGEFLRVGGDLVVEGTQDVGDRLLLREGWEHDRHALQGGFIQGKQGGTGGVLKQPTLHPKILYSKREPSSVHVTSDPHADPIGPQEPAN